MMLECSSKIVKTIVWRAPTQGEINERQYSPAVRLLIIHDKQVEHVAWHSKGDYFVTCCPAGASKSVHVHRLSQRTSQAPFRKCKDQIQAAVFHPSKPFIFIASQRHIRIYNLIKQQIAKKLQAGVKWISSIAVHPGGDNLIIGSYDKKVCWFDLDMSSRPFNTMRYHKKAVRGVNFHRRYPLFATCSDDGAAHVFHGRVYTDVFEDPLIVPIKILRGHRMENNLGVLHCAFHPSQPWLFTSGADGNLILFT